MKLLRIKELIKLKGITSKELANRVEVTPASISNIINGNSFPKPELLISIANVLDVDVKELFISTKTSTPLNGFIDYRGVIYRIQSIDDLKQLVKVIEG